MSEDRSVTRDDKGRFISASLSSDEASRIGKLSGEVRKGESKDELLRQAGYDPPGIAPEHLQLLAKMAAGRGAGAVPALRDFVKLTAKPDRQTDTANNCEYADNCILLTAYRDTARQDDIDSSKQRLEDSRANGG